MADALKVAYATVTGTSGVGDSEDQILVASSATITVLSVTLCNTEASDDADFDLYIRDNNGSDIFYIYKNQSLPSLSTFEHTSKIVLQDTDTLNCVLSADSQDIDVIISYLNQT